MLFEGEYLNGYKLKGKEFNTNGELIFEREYRNEEKRWIGKGKEYDYNDNNLSYEREYLNGIKWN